MFSSTENQQQSYAPQWVGHQTDKGPTRPANEDALWVPNEETPVDLGALYVVADGVGGQRFGAAASQLATKIVPEVFYTQRERGEPIPTALKQAIQGANLAILDDAQRRGGQRMGSTIVAAVQDGQKLHIANVGDARAYLLRDANLQQLTQDDTWVQRQVDAGLLTAEEAAKHELRNVVTQVLGNKTEIEIHLPPVQTLQVGDQLLLCSDGVYDAVSAHEISKIMASYAAAEAALQLIGAATAAEARDNITAVILAPDILPPPISEAPTMMRSPQPPSPAPAPAPAPKAAPAKRASSSLTWLWIILALLFIGLIVVIVLNLLNGTLADAANDAPTLAAPLPTLALTAVSTTETPPPQPTATIAVPETPTEIITPPPAFSGEATTTEATVAVPQTCTSQTAMLWREAQIDSNQCNQFASASLPANEPVTIIDNNARIANGPDEACAPDNRFLKVQSLNDPTQEGWVLEIAIDQTGSSCNS